VANETGAICGGGAKARHPELDQEQPEAVRSECSLDGTSGDLGLLAAGWHPVETTTPRRNRPYVKRISPRFT